MNADFSAAIYLANGTLDATFSPGGAEGNGRGVYPTPGADTMYSMAVQSDGKILLAGSTNTGDEDVMVMRLTTTGALDPTFAPGGADGNGIFTLVRAGSNEQPYGLQVDSNGGIYIGSLWTGASDILLARLDANGALDATFSPGGSDGNGILIVDTGGSEYLYAMDVAPNGDVVATTSRNNADIVVVRVDRTGTLVPTFAPGGADGNGIATVGNADPEVPRGIRVLADGSIVVSGYTDVANADARLWKLTPTGALDPTFGVGGTDGNGIATFDFTGSADWLRTIREQADGKLVVVGHSGNGANEDIAVLRTTAAGVADPTFSAAGAGGDGRARVDFGGNEQGYGFTILDDGSFIVGGSSSSGNFSLARFGSDTIANYAGTWAGGTNTFAACLVDASAGAAQWNEVGTGNCLTTTNTAWNPVPADTSGGIADVVTFSGPASGATVDLRFGMRTATNQPPGAYVAPITFSFVAP